MDLINRQNAINALEKTQWIPCSERLPNSTVTYYLITVDKGEVDIGWWSGSNWESFSNAEVIAWTTLPEPYNESK